MFSSFTDTSGNDLYSTEAITSFSDGAIHEDELLKCYMNCLFHEYEVVDDNGEFHMEKVKERIPDSLRAVAIPFLDKCFNVHVDGETQCQRAFLLHECWKKADPLVSEQDCFDWAVIILLFRSGSH